MVRDKKYKNNITQYKESGQLESSYGYGNWGVFDLMSLGFLNFAILNLFLNFSINFLSILSL